jgi:hypothetical protein
MEKLTYIQRYENNDKFDRWALKVIYNQLCIAWISRVISCENVVTYRITDFFPSSTSDNPHYTGINHNLPSLKLKLKKRFNKFVKTLNK